MRFKQIIAGKAGLPEEIIPNTYQMLGKVLLLKLSHPQALKAKKKIAAAIIKTFPYVKTVALQKGVSGEFRQPKVEIIAGEKKTLTIHKELSCSFKLDVKKIMWSKGNHHERKRLLRLVKPNEIIVDMFSGIGYFSLILGKLSRARRIIAIEKNPESFNFLVDNIVLNKLHNITAINDDCRNFTMKNKAERVLVGYFPGTIKFLPYALKLSKKGTIIHYHDLAADENELKREILKVGKGKLKVLNAREVKEYSPSKRHYVFDLQFVK